jgi:hypothetical protein
MKQDAQKRRGGGDKREVKMEKLSKSDPLL